MPVPSVRAAKPLILIALLLTILAAATAQVVHPYDDFSARTLDAGRWELINTDGDRPPAASTDGGILTVSGRMNRSGAATRDRLGPVAAVEVDALGYTGVNQILQLYAGEGDFNRYVEFGIEGAEPDGRPTLHVWSSDAPAWAGPSPALGPVDASHPLHLRIERDGATFRFFANGNPVHTVAIPALAPEARVVLYGFGESVSRWDNLALSGPDVRIDAPAPGTTLPYGTTGIDVRGAAPAAASWRLDAGPSEYPRAWKGIAKGQGAPEGRLGRWSPPANAAGTFTIRLTARDASGLARSRWVPVILDRAAIWEPREGQVVGPAFTIAVHGNVAGVTKARFLEDGKPVGVATKSPFYARIVPKANGRHTLTVELLTAAGVRTAGPVHVTVKRDLYGRNARVAADGRSFVFPDGTTTVAIGDNESYTWNGLREMWVNGNVESGRDYLREVRTHGINVLRMMLEGVVRPPEDLLEDPIGTYRRSVVTFWDRFLPLCERHNMTVLLTPWDTFWINQPWSASPYNKANGGPCETPHDFIVNPEARKAEKARLKFMIDRWGNSPAIFAIDLLNEFDIWWDATPKEREEWIDDMASYVRGYELKKWGHAHMLTVSAARPEPGGVYADITFRHPLFEWANSHLYTGPVRNPGTPFEMARSIDAAVRYALGQIQDGRPYMDTEHGPMDRWVPDEARDNEDHRYFTWAHFAAGGAGTGMRWPYRNPHILSAGMERNLQTIAQVANHLDWKTFRPENADARLSLDRPGVTLIGSSDKEQAVVWAVRPSGTPEMKGARLTLTGMRPGRYYVTRWDARTGFPIVKSQFDAPVGTLMIPLTPFTTDTAVTLKRKP